VLVGHVELRRTEEVCGRISGFRIQTIGTAEKIRIAPVFGAETPDILRRCTSGFVLSDHLAIHCVVAAMRTARPAQVSAGELIAGLLVFGQPARPVVATEEQIAEGFQVTRPIFAAPLGGA
jgi:hypothetical protein